MSPKPQPELAQSEILEMLEDDQLVRAKERAHLGLRELGPGLRAVVWGLRAYVLVMLVLVAVQVVRAMHAAR